jgi:hypothetical protein
MTQKYLGIAEKIFPDDLFWPSTRLEILRAKGNKDSLFVEYDTIVAHFPKNYLFFFNFGLELYQYASDTSSGHRPANADTLIAKAQVMLKSCLALQPDYPQAALVLGQISYNQGVDLQAQTKKIPGKAPDDIKKERICVQPERNLTRPSLISRRWTGPGQQRQAENGREERAEGCL